MLLSESCITFVHCGKNIFIYIAATSDRWLSICSFSCHLNVGIPQPLAANITLFRWSWWSLWTIHSAVWDVPSNKPIGSLCWFGNLEVAVKELYALITSILIKSIWFSSWAKSSFSHTMRGGENFQSGSHEPLPFTVRVSEMPRSLCDSLYYYKSVGSHGIFRCLLSRTASCLQARGIIQEINSAFVESRKCCRVKIFISSKALTFEHQEVVWTSKLFTHIFYFQYSSTKSSLVPLSSAEAITENMPFHLTAFGNQGHLLHIEVAIKRIHFK